MKATFKLKETPEQVALIQAIGSKNLQVSVEAQQSLAEFLGPVVQKVLLTKGTASAVYTDVPYDEDDSPSFPLDLYYGEGEGYVEVWSQQVAGGLPTSQVTGNSELKFMTYTLDSATSFNKRYARKSRLDIVSKATERMINEVLVKQERNAWAVILKALAEASTNGTQHVIRAGTATDFVLNDLNDLMTRVARINESYSSNTPLESYSNGPTDLYVSPEIVGKVRKMASQPIDSSASNTVQNLPDEVRMDIFRNAGMQSIFGVNINQMNEFGEGKKYNTLFDTFADSTAFTTLSGGLSEVFQSDHQILVGIDNSKGSFVRPVARGEDNATFRVQPDDQFNLARVDKAGFWGHLEEGRVCLDARSVAGIIVDNLA